MANPDKPNGFKLVGKLGGSIQNNGVQNYEIASGQAGSIFSGDPVQMLTGGTISVVNSATTVKILGIFRGCKYIDSDGSVKFSAYYPNGQTSTSTIVALVEDSPENLYQVQSSGSLALTDVGANVDLAYTAGDTVSGQSKAEIGSTSTAGTAQFRIIGKVDEPDNAFGTNVSLIVKINEHAYSTTAGV
jgi:hypothetical protein